MRENLITREAHRSVLARKGIANLATYRIVSSADDVHWVRCRSRTSSSSCCLPTAGAIRNLDYLLVKRFR